MDSGTIIAVVGTLGGAVISAIVTYMVQKRVAERQRKWALEDEERHQQQALHGERRKLKRELLARRLDPIEEAVSLMGNAISTATGIEIGMPICWDKSEARQKALRFQNLLPDALGAVVITGSEELKQNWSILVGVYWDLQETGEVGPDGMKKANDAKIAITKLLDEMRLEG